MALFGIGADHKFGSTDTDIGTIYWDKIKELLNIDEDYNRLNRGNAFGGWEYGVDEGTGRRTQEYVSRSPGMKSAEARMDRRLQGEGFDQYEKPSQVSAITDALMADRMEKMGLIDPGVANLKQDQYGDRMGDINQRQPLPPQAPLPNRSPLPPGSIKPSAQAGDSSAGGLGGQDTQAGTGNPVGQGGAMYDAGYDPRYELDRNNPAYIPPHPNAGSGNQTAPANNDRIPGVPSFIEDIINAFRNRNQPVGDVQEGISGYGSNAVTGNTPLGTNQPNHDRENEGMPGYVDQRPSPRPSIGDYGRSAERGYGYATRLRPIDEDKKMILPRPNKQD